MKLGISILAVTLLLGGCAGVYDPSELAAAQQEKALGYDQCNAALAQRRFLTSAGYFECVLAAEEQYARAIKLQRMDIFNIYAARVRLIAVDADAGRISAAEEQSGGSGS